MSRRLRSQARNQQSNNVEHQDQFDQENGELIQFNDPNQDDQEFIDAPNGQDDQLNNQNGNQDNQVDDQDDNQNNQNGNQDNQVDNQDEYQNNQNDNQDNDQDNQVDNQVNDQDDNHNDEQNPVDELPNNLASSLQYFIKQQQKQDKQNSLFTNVLNELKKNVIDLSKKRDQFDHELISITDNESRISTMSSIENQDPVVDNLPDSILKRQDLTKDYIGEFKGTDGTYTAWTDNFRQYLRYLKVEIFIDQDLIEMYPNNRRVENLDAEIYMLLYSKLSNEVKVKVSTTKPETYKVWMVIKQWYDLSSNSLLSKAYKTVMFTKLNSTNYADYVKQYQNALVEFDKNRTTLEDFVKWSFMKNLGEDGKYVRVSFKDQFKKYSANQLMAEVGKVIEPNTSKSKVFSTQDKRTVVQTINKNKPVNVNVSKVQKNDRKHMPKELKKLLANYKCEKCGKLGHCGIYCWSKDKSDGDGALTIIVNNISNDDRDHWIFDSGASIHICNKEQWFTSKFKRIKREFRTSNEGSFLIAEGIGTVKLKLISGDILTLDDVYYCPNAITNLMTNIGLNKAVAFSIDCNGIQVTFKVNDQHRAVKFAEVKDGQNIICLDYHPNVFAVATRSNKTDQFDQGVIKPQSANDSPAELFNQGVKRGVGRPRKLKSKSLAKPTSINQESNLSCDERTVVQEKSDDEKQNHSDENSDSSTTKEDLEIKQKINNNLLNDPIIIENDCFDADEPTKLDPDKTNELWRAVAQRNNIKTAYDVHLYTGHSGQNATRSMCKFFGIVDTSYNCNLCKQLNFKLNIGKKPSLNESVRLMQLVHMDICQPYGRLEAFDGSRYLLTILEDFSKYISVYLLENKSEAFAYFKNWLSMFERMTDNSLVEIRTDNGREFTSNEFDEFVKEKGIKHSFIVPHLHQQNGSIERANKTIEDRIYKLIELHQVSRKYWSEAALYAADQYNRTINTKGMIPYSIVFRKVDDRKTFGFGERMYFYRPKENGKLDRGIGYFMGWSDNRKAYRVLPEKSTVVLNDVYFLSAINNKKKQTESSLLKAVQTVSNTEIKIPNRYNDLFNFDSNLKCRWQDAIKEELKSMFDNNVFEIVNKYVVNGKIIGTQYVFTIKEDKPRARLVARGDWQSADSFSDTYAPTLQFSCLRLLLKMAINLNWFVFSYDVKKAFLNAELHDQVFIELPLGIELIDPQLNKDTQCIKLKRALYGLKQAGREWYLEISSLLQQYGFKSLVRESTILVHQTIQDFMVAVYVDDMVVFCKDAINGEMLLEFLRKKYEIHDRGQLDKILGVNVVRTVCSFKLDLQEMIKNLCIQHNISKNERVKTPLLANEIVDLHENGIDQNFDEYASLLGSLLYIARMTRPDILAAVIQLCQFQQKPKIYHMRKAIRVLTYLYNTIDVVYEIEKSDNLKLVIYSDASVANFHDAKSQHGCAVIVGGSLISYYSNKSKTVTLSANESEIIATTDAARELLYFKKIKCSLEHGNGTEVQDCHSCETTPLLVDNTGVETFAKNGFGKRTRYLNIKCYKIKELCDDAEIQIKHVQSRSNYADMFTKNQKKDDLEMGRKLVGLRSNERAQLSI